jgi:hypothetical protein
MSDPTVGCLAEMTMKPVPFVCPCGDPLLLFKVRIGPIDAEREEWCIGHPNKACSPLIHTPTLKEALDLLLGNLIRYGHYPTAEEFLTSRKWTREGNGR